MGRSPSTSSSRYRDRLHHFLQWRHRLRSCPRHPHHRFHWWRHNRQWGGVETPLTKTPEKAPPSCESSSPELASAPHAKSPGTRHSKQQLAIPASSLRIRPFAAACCSRIHVRDAAPPPVLTSSCPEHQIAAHAGTPAAIGGCGFGA